MELASYFACGLYPVIYQYALLTADVFMAVSQSDSWSTVTEWQKEEQLPDMEGKGKGKGIVHPIKGHEGPNGEKMHNSTLPLTLWRRNYFLILAHPVYKM